MALTRFVVEYENSDGYTYSCTVTVPIEYSSMDDFKRDFEIQAIQAYVDNTHEFKVGKYEFPIRAAVEDGNYYSPSFFTLDEWFDR